MTDRLPYACRPFTKLIIAVGEIAKDDSHLNMTRNQFAGEVMKKTGGGVNPQSAYEWYDQLMTDAYGPSFETITPRS